MFHLLSLFATWDAQNIEYEPIPTASVFTWFSTGFILIQKLHIFQSEQHTTQSPFLKAILAHFYFKNKIKYYTD